MVELVGAAMGSMGSREESNDGPPRTRPVFSAAEGQRFVDITERVRLGPELLASSPS
jgi:hypothetical protein